MRFWPMAVLSLVVSSLSGCAHPPKGIMEDRLNWESDGRDWPHREASRFVRAGGMTWHVQEMGKGPPLLLVHGTGASTHSWRDAMPLLAGRFRVIAVDLPGHGFSDMPPPGGLTLDGMAQGLGALMREMKVRPELAAGHSAGAAILLRSSLDGGIAPKGIVSLNGALLPFDGVAGAVFKPLARLLIFNPLTPRLIAWWGRDRAAVDRLIRGTGSPLSEEGVALYARLFGSPAHAAAAMGMMANWDLRPLSDAFGGIDTQVLLVAAGDDKAVPADAAYRVRDRIPGARVDYWPGLGHLAHEEDPQKAADAIAAFGQGVGVGSGVDAASPKPD
jgi:magnesium chelatase accessory protein